MSRHKHLIVATLAVCSLALLGLAAPASATYPGANGAIAYSRQSGPVFQAPFGIWTVDPDGSDDRQLIGRGFGEPAWSANGRRIAFKAGPGIDVARADGSSRRRVKHPRGCEAPAFSPSGKRLVFQCAMRSPQLVATMIVSRRLDGSHERTLTHARSLNASPTYSPNSKWIGWVHASRGNAHYSIFAMHPNGSAKHRITVGGGALLGLDWSPKGGHLAFMDPRGIVVVGTDGSNPHLVVPRDIAFESGIGYSPDGRYIAFSGPGSDPAAPSFGLDTVTTDGQNLHTVLNNPSVPLLDPAWRTVPSTVGRR
jgi:WD40-like Beta Propeller Repeat